jgi:hypothetical protein
VKLYSFPAETIHSVKKVGTDDAKELATYVVEKGKPLIVSTKVDREAICFKPTSLFE